MPFFANRFSMQFPRFLSVSFSTALRKLLQSSTMFQATARMSSSCVLLQSMTSSSSESG